MDLKDKMDLNADIIIFFKTGHKCNQLFNIQLMHNKNRDRIWRVKDLTKESLESVQAKTFGKNGFLKNP